MTARSASSGSATRAAGVDESRAERRCPTQQTLAIERPPPVAETAVAQPSKASQVVALCRLRQPRGARPVTDPRLAHAPASES